jgi:hypothetical protein
MLKLLGSIFILALGLPCFAKTANPVCNGVVGSGFTSGDGSIGNPYLICNTSQFTRLSSEIPLLTKSFQLGADLDFTNTVVNIIGSVTAPFQANFNGDGYTLSAISIFVPANRFNNIGLFGYLSNANIRNLIINGITMQAAKTSYQQLGGVAGFAQNSTITKVQVIGLNAKAPSRSGGIIGYAINTTLSNCSTSGSLTGHAYASGLGGLLGRADNSTVSSSSSNVNISIISNNLSSYFGTKVGGLFGYLVNTKVSNVYSQGNIDFSNIANSHPTSGIGGLVGIISGGSIEYSYYAGKMINILGTSVGGVIGMLTGTAIQNVIWDQLVSGQTFSAGGVASVTCLMIQSSYWIGYGFNPAIWKLIDGSYPTLL